MDKNRNEKISLLCNQAQFPGNNVKWLSEKVAKKFATEIVDTPDVDVYSKDNRGHQWCGKSIYTIKKSLSYFRNLARIVEIQNSRRSVIVEKRGYGIGKRIFVSGLSHAEESDRFVDIHCAWVDYDETLESKRNKTDRTIFL
jgi:hypothetical protein